MIKAHISQELSVSLLAIRVQFDGDVYTLYRKRAALNVHTIFIQFKMPNYCFVEFTVLKCMVGVTSSENFLISHSLTPVIYSLDSNLVRFAVDFEFS